MARWRDQPEPVPEQLARFVPSEWPGSGVDGIREWKDACLAWLDGHPGRVLPFGGPLHVLREAVRLSHESAR